ncbi:MAG: hypothetical protein KJ649_00525 [Proteobacteria bacterium]|nr:hypothetical protein [Pseudomonadota bacterium]MBU1966006.1 hypothetical protein [Pseudomonadota bacterium]
MKTRVWPPLLLVPVFVLVYFFLERGTNYLVYSILSMDRGSHLTEAVRFFIFEVPKVLLLLTAIVFVVGIIRSYFSPEKTRKALEGKPLFLGNIMASSLGTSLAFMMSVIGLSLPEMIILKKVVKLPLILIFIGVVASGIMVVGYLFNMIY